MSYKAPNPYVESVAYKGNTPLTNSNSIMGMVGITPMGDTSKAVLVTSWSEYIEKFALQCETPFRNDSDLSHAVYGFFQNGGSLLYIARVVGMTVSVASKDFGESQDAKIKVKAKCAGAWGNDISTEVTAYSSIDNGDYSQITEWQFNVYYKDILVESFIVSEDKNAPNYFEVTINGSSDYITIGEHSDYILTSLNGWTKTALSDGDDDISNISDNDYKLALNKFDGVHNLSAIGIPGQTSVSVVKSILDYTKGKPILPVLEIPEASIGVTEAITFAKTNSKGKNAVLYGPQLVIADPLSTTTATVEVSCVGHIMGVIARTIDIKGEWNAAAGTDAVIKGALGVTKVYTDEERGKLNDEGINVLLTKPNYGTVIWGARSQSDDPELKYESNLTLNQALRRNISDSMQKFEFKNNNPSLWVDITADITGILETKRLAGAFAGDTAETCYYVKCDGTNNTQSTIDKGQVIVEVGYAANKPAEFIIVRVAHQISN